MIQIILPVSCVTMLKESMESEEIDLEKTTKKNAKVVTIAEVLKFNSLKEDYFASQKKCEASLKKAAGI